MRRYATLILTMACVGASCRHANEPARPSEPAVHAFVGSNAKEPIQPLPENLELDPEKVNLGEALFSDPHLSHDDTISCASCHCLETGGTDQRPTAIGINGAVGTINTPTVFNSGNNFKQFWDGRAETLEDQIDFPVQDPAEMGSTWPEVIAKLRTSPRYLTSFSGLYRDGIERKNVKDAIATFERSLRTPDSRFDQYLRGDESALNDDEKRGYQIFKSYGCVSCHQGVNVGGNMFQTFGVMADYFADRGHISRADFGRYNVTGNEADRYVFKVPSLRNVERTAPYFHDGSVTSLSEAVQVMGKYQLGRHLSQEETQALVKFLKTLTGTFRGRQQ